MHNVGLQCVPEDVYFSKSMIDYKIGKVAPRNVALRFSQETQKSENSLGGHNHWLAERSILDKPYINVYSLGSRYILGNQDHRSGWKHVIENAMNNDIILDNNRNNDNPYRKETILIDSMETHFLFDDMGKVSLPWIGILHFPVINEKFLQVPDMNSVLEKAMSSLSNCKGIIVLSRDTKKTLEKKLHYVGLNIKVHLIKHPIENIPNKFCIDNFVQNKTHHIIQLGQQYRKVSTIYTIRSSYLKKWVGETWAYDQVYKELNNMRYIGNPNMVERVEKLDNDKYDELIMNNIVIIPLWEAAANNSVLECIEMNIPAFITRLPSTEEYLGKDYPMFYTEITEIENIINNEELLYETYKKTHDYLLHLDKSECTYSHFNSELLKILNY